MNIVIPLAGKDPILEKAGLFKPLIDIGGRPLIIRCTESFPDLFNPGKNRMVFIVLQEHERKFSVSARLKALYTGSEVRVVPQLTEGAAATVLSVKEIIDSPEELAIYLADIYFQADLYSNIQRCRKENLAGFIPCFPSSNKKYSYAVQGKDGFVSKVAEKEVISSNASAGFYFFSHGSDFVQAADEMIRKDIRVNGLFYICPVYNQLLPMKKKVLLAQANYLFGLGNVAEIKAFKKSLISASGTGSKHEIFAHRGIFTAYSPENSFGALANAALNGYSIELDVRMTRDGVLVISHDSDMSRGFKMPGKIEEKTYAELSKLDFFAPGNRIVLLEDFLAFFKDNSDFRCQIAMHIKNSNMPLIEKVSELLLKYTLAGRVFLFDISIEAALAAKAKFPFIRCGVSIVDNAIKKKMGFPNYYVEAELPQLSAFDVFWIDEWHDLYSESFLKAVLSLGKEIVAISPELHRPDGNSKDMILTWRKLINTGCGKICTDYPLELHALKVSMDDKSNTI